MVIESCIGTDFGLYHQICYARLLEIQGSNTSIHRHFRPDIRPRVVVLIVHV